MIVGLGQDIIDIRRVERVLARYGDRFTQRIFTPAERAKADARARRAETYAKRFAAKEACAKALGTGFSEGVFWRDIGVVNAASGAPGLSLTGGAAKRLAMLVPAGYQARLQLSITDDHPLASAIVIISCERSGETGDTA